MPSHNQKLTQLLKETQQRVEVARTFEDVLAAVQRCAGFAEVLRYHQAIPLWCLIAGLVFLGWAYFQPAWGWQLSANMCWVIGIAGTALALGGWAMLVTRFKRMQALTKEIKQNAMLLCYGLTPQKDDLPRLLEQLGTWFKDFDRGNHKRELRQVYSGIYVGRKYRMAYTYYHLYYVEKQHSGNGTSYSYIHRYYLVVQFPWVDGITLCGDGSRYSSLNRKYRFESTSQEFNKFYTLTGTQKMSCPRFAIPVTVMLMPQFAAVLQRPNFTFNGGDLGLCLSFDDKHVFTPQIKDSLKHPWEFYLQLSQHRLLPKFEKVMALLHQLAEQHDDNFALVSASLGDNGALPKSI